MDGHEKADFILEQVSRNSHVYQQIKFYLPVGSTHNWFSLLPVNRCGFAKPKKILCAQLLWAKKLTRSWLKNPNTKTSNWDFTLNYPNSTPLKTTLLNYVDAICAFCTHQRFRQIPRSCRRFFSLILGLVQLWYLIYENKCYFAASAACVSVCGFVIFREKPAATALQHKHGWKQRAWTNPCLQEFT